MNARDNDALLWVDRIHAQLLLCEQIFPILFDSVDGKSHPRVLGAVRRRDLFRTAKLDVRTHSNQLNENHGSQSRGHLGPARTLCQLQVERDALSIDEYGSGVDELLAGAVIQFVTAKVA